MIAPNFMRSTQAPAISPGVMIANDLDGLMMAGRCISGDFIAHSSYRVTGNAVAMGKGAGRAASFAAQSNHPPHELAVSTVGGWHN